MAEETASVEDRIADHFGFGDDPEEVEETEEVTDEAEEAEESEESEEEQPEEGKEEEPALEEIEIDGQLYEVPPALKEAFMRNADYTQKTQTLSAEKKQYEVLAGQLDTAQKQYEFMNSIADEASQIQVLDNQVKQYREYMRSNIDSLSGQELEKLRFAIDEANVQKQALTEAVQKKWQDHQQAHEQSVKELMDKSTEVLRSKIPNWNEALEKEVTDYGRQLGFTESQISIARLDPRQMELVHKALAYDKLQQGKAQAVKKAKEAPAIKPKSRNPMPDNVKRKLNFKKNMSRAKSDKDKAALIEADLERMFR